jgi:hypothetical protein
MGAGTKLNFKKAILYFIWAYIIVTVLAYSLSYLVGSLMTPVAQAPGASIFDDPVFVKTVPYHLLINLLVWTLCSYAYFKRAKDKKPDFQAAIYLSFLWLVLAMLVDLTAFVLIKSPVSLTPHQFYIEYQPWISITYLILFVSPLISYAILKRRMR